MNWGSYLGAIAAPALTPFKGDLFLTSRCASLIIFGDSDSVTRRNGVRIHEERRLMKEIDKNEGMEKNQNFLIKDSEVSLWTRLAYFEMPELPGFL